jgi:glycosyltransferase involved in cell wall biosynthesis
MVSDCLDICIVTYNRLEYLKLCVWSILASTKQKYRLFVISDNSNDGTNEWLTEMKSLGKIDEVILNSENLGSAASFNKVIRATNSEFFVMTCDDMWFHRGWDEAVIQILNEFRDCGMVTFFNFPINPNDSQLKIVNDHTYFRQSTGLGSTLISRRLFEEIGGLFFPEGLKMGYFAKGFCKSAAQAKSTRKKQYLTNPYYAEQMDRRNPGSTDESPLKLSHEHLYREYNAIRSLEKNKFKQG